MCFEEIGCVYKMCVLVYRTRKTKRKSFLKLRHCVYGVSIGFVMRRKLVVFLSWIMFVGKLGGYISNRAIWCVVEEIWVKTDSLEHLLGVLLYFWYQETGA